ncbi:MAG TPA: glycosyltransferase family 39 protein [Candidatus Acidoferrales bacterium]|nr:glycosyltransferase family 39 protein [Candidatus Acidoferrales bacterium]
MSTQPLDAPIAPPLENHANEERDFRWARRIVLLVIALAALQIRAQDLGYSTAYMDETIYVVYGRMFLSGNFQPPLDTPLQWSFGWYLWPAMAASAEKLGGMAGVRLLGALLGTLTVFAVYGFARRLFTPVVGLASAMVFALLAPSVYVFRIATRDAAALFFFAVGMWLYARAWQEREVRSWLGAALSFFAAFLCKYIVALYFPFLALLCFREGRQALRYFVLPLTSLCAAYAAYHLVDLYFLLHYGRGYESLRVPAGAAWEIYVTQRWDFWTLVALSFMAWRRGDAVRARVAGALWLGVFLTMLFQWTSRADFDWWKHINYALLFLIPLAMTGFLRMVRRWSDQQFFVLATLGVVVLSVVLGWVGGLWKPHRYVFWPNVEPVLAYFDGRLTPQNKLLVDDTVFRHYFHPPVPQGGIADPFNFEWRSNVDAPAYAAAIREGHFDYVVFDGGIGEDARRLQMVAHATMKDRYALRMTMPDPFRGQRIEIFERTDPPVAAPPASNIRVEITSPASGELVRTNGGETILTGRVAGSSSSEQESKSWPFGAAQGKQDAGATVQIEVFTNKWYPQGAPVTPAADGTFRAKINLGGQGAAQCHHLLRARLLDSAGKVVASDSHFGIIRAMPDGSPPPACKTAQ